jgi:hypothetical protein
MGGKAMPVEDVDWLLDDKVAQMCAYINERYRDIPAVGWDANLLRACATDAFNKLIAGDYEGAFLGISRLDPRGKQDFLRKLGELKLVPKEWALLPKEWCLS